MRRRYNNIDNRTFFALYHFDNNLNDSIGNNHGSNGSGSLSYSTGKFGNGAKSTGYIQFPNNFLRPIIVKDFTIDFWAKHEGTNQGFNFILESSAGSMLYSSIRIEAYEDGTPLKIGGNLYLEYNSGNAHGTQDGFSGIQSNSDKWNHYALVRNNNVFKFYINGKLVLTFPYSATTFSSGRNYNRFMGNSYITIDELAISEYAVWTEEFEPPTKPYK